MEVVLAAPGSTAPARRRRPLRHRRRWLPKASASMRVALMSVLLVFLLGLRASSSSATTQLFTSSPSTGSRRARCPWTWASRFDRLSGALTLVVTGVGFLIHVYSVGYIDEGSRLLALLLVPEPLRRRDARARSSATTWWRCSSGWEGVGLCSYLLIGFWFTDEEKAYAGRKAFIVTAKSSVVTLEGSPKDGGNAAGQGLPGRPSVRLKWARPGPGRFFEN